MNGNGQTRGETIETRIPARQLEDIAEPLSATDGEQDDGRPAGAGAERSHGPDEHPRGRVRGRYRPGPARYRGSPGMPVSHPYAPVELRREVEMVAEGRVRRLRGGRYAPAGESDGGSPASGRQTPER